MLCGQINTNNNCYFFFIMNIDINNLLYVDSNKGGNRDACLLFIISPLRIITALLLTIYSLVVIGKIFNKAHSSSNEWGDYASIAVIFYNLIMGIVFVGVSIADFIASYQMKASSYTKGNSYYIVMFLIGFLANIVLLNSSYGYIETILGIQFILNIIALVSNLFVIGVFTTKLCGNGCTSAFCRE